ncbi:hypothetical protein ACH4SK_43035 [Streptomyces inhibens]|uniref:hypothetical protein n=1 Tax=Streptomyces inhibens TaxID=2293571 RepID=UPI003792B8E9
MPALAEELDGPEDAAHAVQFSGVQALDLVYEAAVAAGLNGIQLHTHWVWQSTDRWYLARSMWVTSWKHDLGLSCVKYLPQCEVTRSRQGFTFSAEGGDVMTPLLIAGREGDALRLRRTEEYGRSAEEGIATTARSSTPVRRSRRTSPSLPLPADLPTPSCARTAA